MRALQSRLLAGTAIGTVLVLSASGLVLYVLVRASLIAEFDGALAAKARALSALVEQEGHAFEMEIDERGMDEFERAERPEFFQLWLTDGKVLTRSRSLGGRDLERISAPYDHPVYRWTTLPDGRPGRVVGIAFTPYQDKDEANAEPRPVTLVVARDTADIERTLARLRWLLTAVCAVGTVLSLGVLAGVVRLGLRPLARLAGEIEELGEQSLSSRFDPARVPRELAPIVDRLNDLLDRLHTAFARERSFSADVAHELRTPLAGLRSTLEVSLSRQRGSDDYREAIADCLVMCEQTQRMVDTLLSLARVEAGQTEVHTERVQLDEVLRECWVPLAEAARCRGLRVTWYVDRRMSLDTDAEKLRLIVQNVLDNAVTHSNTGGSVQIEAGLRNGCVRLIVTNTGNRLSADDAEHVFDRFWRGDSAREGTGQHCGLGLSLCKQLSTLLGGSISVDFVDRETFRVTVVFNTVADQATASG